MKIAQLNDSPVIDSAAKTNSGVSPELKRNLVRNNVVKIAVILAGCGRMDGSEIQESVLTLLSIRQNKAVFQCFSLDLPQNHVSNHLTNESVPSEKRNMLVESARIARGEVKPLEELEIAEFDALIIPGGNGVAYNLFDFATNGKDYIVNPLVKHKCLEFTKNKLPVGFICIAPAMIPGIYGPGIELTIGTDKETSELLTTMGAKCFDCLVDEIHIDKTHKIVTTPAYMLANHIGEAYLGVKHLVDAIINLVKEI
ncbi:MAG: isoprenoid biosynthesis protein ElbB [Burkholderiales bacterium]|jgi:enhancing lycopene biosynthesis protein 2|nr:isoprenoid biosynthesis protein ElbB [Burkholderiales bacterium]MCE3268012.1 isoprenoid biosynthesis protein ElbB [Burkholderiales bacterium]